MFFFQILPLIHTSTEIHASQLNKPRCKSNGNVLGSALMRSISDNQKRIEKQFEFDRMNKKKFQPTNNNSNNDDKKVSRAGQTPLPWIFHFEHAHAI